MPKCWTILLLLFTLTTAAGAEDFTYATNNGTITITGYTGLGGAVTIPSEIDGLPVTSVGTSAFRNSAGLTSVTIPDSITNIGADAFASCHRLTNAVLGKSLSAIGEKAFFECGVTRILIPSTIYTVANGTFLYCTRLASVTIPNSVTNIGRSAFYSCYSLTTITIPSSVTTIQDYAFYGCSGLAKVYFKGNAPTLGQPPVWSYLSTIYYLPGTTGWGPTFGGRPTAPWYLPQPSILSFGPSFGVQTNRFGFRISWATNTPVIVRSRFERLCSCVVPGQHQHPRRRLVLLQRSQVGEPSRPLLPRPIPVTTRRHAVLRSVLLA